MQSKFSLRFLRLVALVFGSAALIGCFGEGDGKARVLGTPAPPLVIDDGGYVLVFADEFNEGTAPSAANWTIETGYGPNNAGWGNNEWQLYTDSPDNVRVENGNLVLSALCATPPCGLRDGTITSGKINSLNKFNFKFGRVEARIKPPVGKAAWPAFWALGANHPDIGWPRSGEIDFMEMHNAFSNDRTTHFTVHWCDETVQAPEACTFPEGWIFDSQSTAFTESLGNDFHIFEADWNADRIIGKIDGIPFFTRTIEPDTMEEFLREFYMILNVAMGGTLGSDNREPDGTEVFPQTMLVDYVRVYQLPGGGGSDGVLFDFEDGGPDFTFANFEGGVGSIVDNPHSDSNNSSAKVGQMQKFASGATFGGTTITPATPLEVTSGSTFTMNVWSPRSVEVLFKLEGTPSAEASVVHGGTGWEELTFALPGANGSFSGITLIFDIDTAGDAAGDPDNWTFYFDDIAVSTSTGGGGPGSATIDFEDAGGPYTFNNFEGGVGLVVNNPDPTGINTSDRVGQMLKFAGADFAGTTLKPNNPIELTAGSSYTMKVWSPRPVPVLFKLESASPVETSATYSGSGWQELTFDFPGASGTFTGITLIFDNGVVGDADGAPNNWTFYFDDITLIPPDTGGGGDPGDNSLFDFEQGTYTFNDFEGGAAAVIDNPVSEGINTSARVGQMLKFAGADYAGSTLEPAMPLEVAAGSSYTMKVWSSRPVPVLFKLEGTPSVETTVNHGGTGWELLTFDVGTADGTYTGITLIFDIGVVGDADGDPNNWTFYFDDITLIPPDTGGGGDPDPGDNSFFGFEQGTYTFNDFEGGAAAVIDNPVSEGINTSARVGQMLKFAGADYAGSTLEPAMPLEVAAGSSYTMKVWSSRPVPVLFKLEGTPSVETTVNHGGTGWELLTFDVGTADGTYTGITLIFDIGVVGDADGDPNNWTFYFDDITLIPPDTGGGGDPDPGDNSFFGFEQGTYTFNDFEGGAAAVIDNPVSEGINTSARVGQMLKFAGADYAGSTLEPAMPLEVAAGSSYTMKVWSSRPVPVLFKLEGTPSVETTVNHGGTGWELLTFDVGTADGTYTGITLIFDIGVVGDADGDPNNWTFYFDDITLIPPDTGGGGDPGDNSLFDFEQGTYTFNDFEGGAAAVIDNPVSEGINTSARVGQMLKFAGADYAGSTLEPAMPLEVAAGSSYTMKVWSPRAVTVLFKLEGTPSVETTVNHGGTGWELLTFDVGAADGTYTGITLIFDIGIVGDADANPDDWTFYFDDITLVPSDGGGGDPGDNSLFDFEQGTYTFNDFEGGAAAIINNPVSEGINTSARVGQMLKFAGADFAGSTLVPTMPLEVAAGSSYTMKVWSPRAVTVLFKLEGTPSVETTVNHGGTGWELLTFDVGAADGTYTGITLIFDIGIVGDADANPDDWTFYFDDITLVPSDGGGGDPGDNSLFDFEQGTYTFNDFEGGAAAIINNPVSEGINTSARVGQMLKFAGADFAGSTLVPAMPLEVAAGSSYTMKVWSPRAVTVLFKLEGTPDVETTVNHGGTGWELLTFDVGTANGTYTGITLIFDIGVVGDAAANPDDWTFYFDEITLVPFDDGGIDPGVGTTSTIVTDFEGDPLSYDFGLNGGTGGAMSSVIDNPVPDANNDSAQVAQLLKFAGQTFGRSTLTLATPLDIPLGSSFTINVWSQRPVPVALKLEGPVVSPVEVSHGGTGWEVMTFDFATAMGSVNGLTFFFDNGTNGAAATDPLNWTFYFDHIVLVTPGGGSGMSNELVNFEGDPLSYDFGLNGGTGGAMSSVIDNPVPDANNDSAQVAQLLKFAGQTFGRSTLTLDAPVDIPLGSMFTINVWSQRLVPVALKLEGPIVSPVEISHGGTGWEVMTFDFATAMGSVNGLTFFFDNGTNGAAATDPVNWTFYFDDITLITPAP